MTRFTAVPTLLSLSALVVVAACSADSKKAADTLAVDTTATATVAASTTTSTTTAADTTKAIAPININTATDAQILAIPGVGKRMLREFKEYRPWTSIEQFRREIGKYVDKTEVARLEKYIVIK